MLERSKWNRAVTDAAIIASATHAMQDFDYPGFCLACGHKQGGVEPDARRYACESCGERQVYGAEELMLALDWDGIAVRRPTTLWDGNPDADAD